jgi:MFS superfamily sulfate permease-like transporter
MRSDGPLVYPNAEAVRRQVYDAARAAKPRPDAVVLDLSTSTDLDVQSADALSDLARQLQGDGIALRLADVRRPAGVVLRRAGTADLAPLFRTVGDAVHPREVTSDHPVA